jgi:type I restriction enzyme M protein
LLFFEKGTPTKEIWYYEHRLPEGQKSYSKTKGIQFSEFAPMIKWWNKRKKSDVAWKVKVEDLKRGFDLDAKNPHREDEEKDLSASEVLSRLNASIQTTHKLLAELQRQIG